MKGSDLMDWLLKFCAAVIVLPLVLIAFIQAVVAVLVPFLPWLLGLAVVVGVTAGLSAGFVIRKKLIALLRESAISPGLGRQVIRRPRGPRGRADE
jgi:hypothetical protein